MGAGSGRPEWQLAALAVWVLPVKVEAFSSKCQRQAVPGRLPALKHTLLPDRPTSCPLPLRFPGLAECTFILLDPDLPDSPGTGAHGGGMAGDCRPACLHLAA